MERYWCHKVTHLLSLFRNTWIWIWSHSSFLIFSHFLFYFLFFSSLNFSLYSNNLLLASLKRASLKEQSYVIHKQWPIAHSLSHSWVICAAEKPKGDTKPFCSGFMGQGKGIMVFMVLLEVKEQRLGIIWQMKLCVKRGQGCWVNWKRWMRDGSNSDLGKRFLDIRAADKELTYSVLKKHNFTLSYTSLKCVLWWFWHMYTCTITIIKATNNLISPQSLLVPPL